MRDFSEEVVDYLVAWRKNKSQYENTKTDIRNELVRLAVETGLPQEEAMNKNLFEYFDGWLIARGHMQSFRRTREED